MKTTLKTIWDRFSDTQREVIVGVPATILGCIAFYVVVYLSAVFN